MRIPDLLLQETESSILPIASPLSNSVYKMRSVNCIIVACIAAIVVAQAGNALGGPKKEKEDKDKGHGNGKGQGQVSGRGNSKKSDTIDQESIHQIQEYEVMIESGVSQEAALRSLSVTNTECQVLRGPVQCNAASRFRTIDGTCNNLWNTRWGASFTPFERLINPDYEDGYNSPRGGLQTSRLPTARLVSTTVHPDLVKPDLLITNMLPHIGQFLDHDLTLAPTSAGPNCCNLLQGITDSECFPIKVPTNDPFYGSKNITCLTLRRSTPFCFQGRLLANSLNSRFLPSIANVNDRYGTGSITDISGVFAAGYTRVNENPPLTVLQTLFFREHNRLANEIQSLRPLWSDEEIFQNARRILIAMWQKIVYGEFLPVVLGPSAMTAFNLQVSSASSTYNPQVNPGILNSFGAAAYRFGHNLIDGVYQMIRDITLVSTFRLRDSFNNGDFIQQNNGEGYELILTGLFRQNCQTPDRFVTEDLSNFLFRATANNFGQDLISRNIQRGRDHGVPTYNEFRIVAGLSPLGSWNEKPSEISQENWDHLSYLYCTLLNIDLFTGGLAETILPKGVTGPVFNHIMATQFQRLKFGDRFFYTHEGQSGSFTSVQRSRLDGATLGDIVCRNSAIQRTPRNVFAPASTENPNLSCSDTVNRKFISVADFI